MGSETSLKTENQDFPPEQQQQQKIIKRKKERKKKDRACDYGMFQNADGKETIRTSMDSATESGERTLARVW